MHFGVMKQIINFFTPFLKFLQISQIRLDDVSDVNFKQCIIKTGQTSMRHILHQHVTSQEP